MVWLPDDEKKFDMFIRFDTTHKRDRHTERPTDIQSLYDDIGRTYA